MAEARGFIGGLVGGALSGALASGLMRIRPPPPAISSSLEQIAQQSVPAGGSVTLKPATLYKFAIVAFHGNGDPQITITVQKGASSATIAGNEQGFEFVANESLQITAQNTDSSSARNTPLIEILSLSW